MTSHRISTRDILHVFVFVVVGTILLGAALQTFADAAGGSTFRVYQKYTIDGAQLASDAAAVRLHPHQGLVFVIDRSNDAMVVYARGRNGGILKQARVAQWSQAREAIRGAVPLEAMDDPVDVLIAPDLRHVYVACRTSNSIVVLGGDDSVGFTEAKQLVKNDAEGVRGLNAPQHLCISPDGSTLYVACQGSSAVVSFDRNRKTGALTFLECHQSNVTVKQIPGSIPVAGLDWPSGIVMSADGKFLYVAGFHDASITSFVRDPKNGELTHVETVQDVVENGLYVSPNRGLIMASALCLFADDQNLAVAAAPGALSVWERDKDSGRLTFVQRLKEGLDDIGGIKDACWITANRKAGNLFVVGRGSSEVVELRSVNRRGKLEVVGRTRVSEEKPMRINCAVVSEDNRFMYVGGKGELVVFLERTSAAQ